MKLYISGNSPYARRARLAAREAGLMGMVEEIIISGFDELVKLGPGGKIPVLITDDGHSLCESLIITHYFNDLSEGKLLPSDPVQKGKCLALESVASVLMDSLFVRSMEKNYREEKKRSALVLEKEAERSRRCYESLAEMVREESESVSLASIAVAASLGYAGWRTPEDNWREGRSGLESYYDRLMERPAFTETMPRY
ncbi:MAG TPA: glutathione S-transferase N-terminal domain-containing protein [Pseudomonadales bacterium]|nr:glutathione S-transferase N-terminal domain-containing protein [Pseudomonadales bacterium]MDP7315316.1 glutathione S-transferase N-terminal domain-containing protein [Pseudomonadales bacterium]MDP7450967.1 glutathione S-transferase N-terminal domain-containing protein [Arenicellales bacterium]HJP50084.1 glutathione S-transferase N-terminal domain-containing protein [Pseudomonadales bacterium]